MLNNISSNVDGMLAREVVPMANLQNPGAKTILLFLKFSDSNPYIY